MDLLYNNILDTFSNLILHTFSPTFPVCGHGPREGAGGFWWSSPFLLLKMTLLAKNAYNSSSTSCIVRQKQL